MSGKRKAADPFEAAQAMLAAQSALLGSFSAGLGNAQAMLAWQQEAVRLAERSAKVQRDWLKLWGL